MSRNVVPIRLPLLFLVLAGHSPAEAEPLTLSGAPSPTAVVGIPYEFLPAVEHTHRALVEFNYINKPDWSKTYRGSGLIRGIPAEPGVYPDIQIGAWDGTQYAQTPPFTITVTATGVACLTWIPPHFNTDGSPLTNLAGYVIRYGTTRSALDRRLAVDSASATAATIEHLETGTWYFDVAAENTASDLSAYSPAVAAAVP